MFTICSHNGRVEPIEQATLSLLNIEFTYGFGVYENVRVAHDVAYFLADHIDRLLHSAKIIDLEHTYSAQGLETIVRGFITALGTGQEAYNLKILLIGGKEKKDSLLYVLPLVPRFPDKKMYQKGVDTITVAFERPFPEAKTLSMLPSYLAYRKAKEALCYDALAVDREGCITEGTRTNFFLVRGRKIFTTPRGKILEGVTKKILLQLAVRNNFEIIEEALPQNKLADYDGAFLTSTSSKVMPVKKINDHIFPVVAPAIHELAGLYDNYLHTYYENFRKSKA